MNIARARKAYTSNTIFKNSAAAAAQGAPNDRHQWGISLQNAKTGEFYQIHNGIKDTGRAMIANIGYGDSWYAMWGAAEFLNIVLDVMYGESCGPFKSNTSLSAL